MIRDTTLDRDGNAHVTLGAMYGDLPFLVSFANTCQLRPHPNLGWYKGHRPQKRVI